MKTFTKDKFADVAAMLIETRQEEAFDMPDSVIAMKYYTMALEDAYYQLTGGQLDTGQDIEPMEWDEV